MLSHDQLAQMYQKMVLIRGFEEQVDDLFARGKVHGTTHLSIGEEATAVGACAPLRECDYVLGTHRGHGQCIARGADVRLMMAELLGKKTGYCRGKGGSMHIADVKIGILGTNGIVGGGIPIATGVGLAVKMQKRDSVVLCFFGDGAVAQGAFHESVNLAALWKLPVVFVCENNQYAMSMPVRRALACGEPHRVACAYGVPASQVDGNDVLAVYRAVADAVDHARKGLGPSLVECNTYRWKGHSKSDANRYRTREEIEAWRKKCPIRRFRSYLLDEAGFVEGELESIDEEVRLLLDEALRYAQESPEPEADEVERDVYAPSDDLEWHSNLSANGVIPLA